MQQDFFNGLLTAACVVGALSPTTARGETEIIVQGGVFSGDPAPDGNGFFSSFDNPVLNNAGQVAFSATLNGTSGGGSDNNGIFLDDGGPIRQIAREHPAGLFDTGLDNFGQPVLNDSGETAFTATFQQSSVGGAGLFDGVFRGSGGPLTTVALEEDPAPDGNGEFLTFGVPVLNASGQAAFHGTLTGTIFGMSDNTGIFRGSGGPITQIARERHAAPDLNGTFSVFGAPSLNASGEVAFWAELNATSGGAADNGGIYRGSGGQLDQIVRERQTVPSGNGTFAEFDFASAPINDAGRVAFKSFLAGTSGGSADNEGIFLSSAGPIGPPLTPIVRKGQTAPDGNGTFFSLDPFPLLNDFGRVAFAAFLTDTSGSTSDDSGIFLGTPGGQVSRFVREGQSAPDGNGTFFLFGNVALNAAGHVAFIATLSGTSGGAADAAGIFLANGIDVIEVARLGDPLNGSTISDLSLSSGLKGDEGSGLNDTSQVAYRAELANGDEAIALFTIPDVHWDLPNSGNWSTAANWSPTIVPNSFHHAFIDPDEGLIVTGNSVDSVVRSLTIGATGSGQAVLQLDNGGDLAALESITINSQGRIEVGTGRVLAAPTLINAGVLIGDGQVDADLVNLPTGQVRVRPGETLQINASTAHSSAGMIETLSGGAIEFNGALTNAAPIGEILGTNATLRFNDGLTNDGSVSLTLAGNVFGNVTNAAGGTITVENSGSDTVFATFHDNVTNSGMLEVSAGSTAVFVRELSGNGNAGSGEVRALGDLVPGTSAGLMSFGGDLTLGPLSFLHIELGGPIPGSEFDQVAVAGDAVLDGVLRAESINGFTPAPGQQFTVLTAANIVDNGLMFGGPLSLSLHLVVDESSVILLTVTGLAGDYNNNGVVDAADYVVWRKNLGAPGGTLPNDFDGGVIGLAQYATWKANFGNTVGSGSLASASVPEPESLILSLFAAASLLGKAVKGIHRNESISRLFR